MYSECSSLPRGRAADRKWADESGEQFGTVEKLVLAALAVLIAGGTLFLPIVVLHVK